MGHRIVLTVVFPPGEHTVDGFGGLATPNDGHPYHRGQEQPLGAKRLAQLCRVDMVAERDVSAVDVRDLRTRVHGLNKLVEKRTDTMHSWTSRVSPTSGIRSVSFPMGKRPLQFRHCRTGVFSPIDG